MRSSRCRFGCTRCHRLQKGGRSFAVDFDELYELMIAPALRQAGCEPFRADEPEAGDIRTDMFFELVTADLVVADISILNPNVFYELGVRHGVAERGVFMITAGWSRRPFDVAPDRTFSYDGLLFVPSTPRDDAWQRTTRRRGEATRGGVPIGARRRRADDRQPCLPELCKGLRPADWSAIETARAKYFEGILDDWQVRVRVARRNGHAGDVLTLARNAPTRFHRGKLMLEAARALVELQRFDVAESVLLELLDLDPANVDAMRILGLVLGRLGRSAEAEQRIATVLEDRPDDPEAQGALGRIHKDAWRAMWRGVDDLDERRRDRPQVGGPGTTRDPLLPPRLPARSRVVLQRDQSWWV